MNYDRNVFNLWGSDSLFKQSGCNNIISCIPPVSNSGCIPLPGWLMAMLFRYLTVKAQFRLYLFDSVCIIQ